MGDYLGSDELRDYLEEELDLNDGSDHASDLESDIGDEFGYDEFPPETHDELNNETVQEDEQNLEENSDEEGAAENATDEAEQQDGWRDWTDGDGKFSKFTYNLDSGYKPPNNTNPNTASEFFQLFFTDALLEEIVNETNRYAHEKIQKNTPLQKKSIWWSWKDVTLIEIKAFLGVLINMGMNEKPEVSDFFSNDWVDYYPFFKDVFSKVRFLQIFWNLHVGPPASGPIIGALTRSGKVRNVVAYLDRKFRQYFVPQKKVSVDESTVGFKGRVLFKVYNKDKPIKWGIKVFVLSDSKSGYICAMEPYFGKSTTDRMERQDLGSTSRVVIHLVNKLKQSYGEVEGFHVFTDRFYTNLDLAKALNEMKVHLTGTIMLNRKGLPEEIRPTRKSSKISKKRREPAEPPKPKLKLKKGQMKTFRDDKINCSVTLWKDTNLVSMLSTLYADNTTNTITRVKKGGAVESVIKPTVVCKYNQYMGGVDIADQYISSYAFSRKSLKWWRKVFFWLLETAVVNAFILFKIKHKKPKLRQRQFRKVLVKELVGDVRNTNKRGRPSNFDEDDRLNGKLHLPYPLDGGKSKDCAVCSDRRAGKDRKRTKFYCKTCSTNPGLHMGQCFEKYHSLKKLKE